MVWQGLLPTLGAAAKASMKNLDKTKVLFATGTMGVISTGVCSAIASPEASRRVNDIKWASEDVPKEERRKYKATRYATEVAPLYIPAALSGFLAILSFGLSNKELSARVMMASAAAGTAERLLESYSEKTLEIAGEEIEKQIRQAVADDIPDEVMEKSRGYLPESEVANLYPHKSHDTLWYDCVMDRMFSIWDASQEASSRMSSHSLLRSSPSSSSPSAARLQALP